MNELDRILRNLRSLLEETRRMTEGGEAYRTALEIAGRDARWLVAFFERELDRRRFLLRVQAIR